MAQCNLPVYSNTSIVSNGDMLNCSVSIKNPSNRDTLYLEVPYIDSIGRLNETYFFTKGDKGKNVYQYYREKGITSHGDGIYMPKLYYISIIPNGAYELKFTLFNNKSQKEYYFLFKYSYNKDSFDKSKATYLVLYDLIAKGKI